MHKLMWLLLVAFSFQAMGDVNFPLQKRLLLGVDGKRFPVGMCPGNPAVGDVFAWPAPERGKINRHLLALSASNAIYNLPDLEMFSDGAQIIPKMNTFMASLPSGYEFYYYVADPESGMKYMVLAPLNSGSPWIMSIAGTESALDWLVDIDVGREQFDKLNKVIGMVTTCQYLDKTGMPLASHDWLITGHSLGGGLAQAVGYVIQQKRLGEQGLLPLHMEVVTFNAFGARQLIAKSMTIDESLVQTLNATNYFVHDEPVSRIGTHLGATIQLTPPGELIDQDVVKPFSPSGAARHKIGIVIGLASDPGLSAGVPRTPVMSGLVRASLKFNDLVKMLPSAIFQSTAREALLLDRFKQATAAALQPGVPRVTRDYIAQLIFSQMSLIHRPPAGPMEENRLAWFKSMLTQLGN